MLSCKVELDYQGRREILKELPVGSVVTYHGPSDSLLRRTFTKLYDRATYMHVVDDRQNKYRLKYYNLSCEKLDIAEQVTRRLNGEPDFDDNPF